MLKILHSQSTYPLGGTPMLKKIDKNTKTTFFFVVGYGRNRSVEFSNGNYLCFQDIDDEMLPKRIEKQLEIASQHKNAVI